MICPVAAVVAFALGGRILIDRFFDSRKKGRLISQKLRKGKKVMKTEMKVEVPEGFEASRISGKFRKNLDSNYILVVEDRGADEDAYWKDSRERVRVYVLKYCGWTTTIKTFKTLEKAFEFAKTVTDENWHEKSFS